MGHAISVREKRPATIVTPACLYDDIGARTNLFSNAAPKHVANHYESGE